MTHSLAGMAEHQRRTALRQQQRVDDRVLALIGLHQHHLILDVGVLLARGRRGETHGIALEGLGEFGDATRHRRRKHQGAALFGRGGEDEFEILAKAQIEHFIGLVEHHGADGAQIERALGDVIAQASGRADDEMRATLQRPTFGAHVHATDAGRGPDAGIGVEPVDFALHLHRQFARRGNDQPQRQVGMAETRCVTQQGRGDGNAERNGLARTGLGRDQQIGIGMALVEHRQLDRCEGGVAVCGKGRSQCRMHGGQRRLRRAVDRRRHVKEPRKEGLLTGLPQHASRSCGRRDSDIAAFRAISLFPGRL